MRVCTAVRIHSTSRSKRLEFGTSVVSLFDKFGAIHTLCRLASTLGYKTLSTENEKAQGRRHQNMPVQSRSVNVLTECGTLQEDTNHESC